LPSTNAEVCPGDILNLDGNPTAGDGNIISHLWSGDTIPLNATNIQTPTFKTDSQGLYTINYIVTDDNGCSNSDLIAINVNPVHANIIPDPAEVCADADLILNGNPSGGTGNYVTHVWTGDVSYLNATDKQSVTFNATTVKTYKLTYNVTDDNGCNGSDSIIVTVFENPIADAGNNDSTCSLSIYLSANPSVGNGTWSKISGIGNIIFEVWKTWVNNNWEYSDRTTFIYSAENYLITKIKDVWTNGNWESSERDSYSYNTSGKVVSFVKELWTNGNWVNNSKTVYVYNDEGDLTYLIQELWKNDVWVNDKQFVYNYDSNHNQTSMISQTWNSGEWFNVSKDSSNYNSSNKKTLYLYQTWNDSLWKNLFKYNYEYNNLDYVETSTMMTWEDSLWVNSEKIN